ncbi:MAG: hypothetical protein PsegKO_06380 [Pseudohongiellaceae bacterium]|jgi:hypothetical protein
MELLQWAGLLLSGYGCYGLCTGRVWAKHGTSSREIHQANEPVTFRVVCLCYILVGGMIYLAMDYRYG